MILEKVNENPFEQFKIWYQEANKIETVPIIETMCLSTIDANGFPDSRVVLLKSFDEDGFTFYTNLNSVKCKHLEKNPFASLCFHWQNLKRQVRIQGKVSQVLDSIADEYFASRPRGSQIGAWASEQSEVLASREILLKKVTDFEKKFENQEIPRPDFWSGFVVKPFKIEFWQDQENRLHDRFQYSLQNDNSWKIVRLNP
ncbi:MAG: pyridoxamine 5'-phosphate oxidase [Calditrichaeota bacterium]|nr:MAG: pyridoxamine 5'-phosphate oxidase [Calditrichota bacterium]